MHNLGITDKIRSGKEIDNNGGRKGEANGTWEGTRRCSPLEDSSMASALRAAAANLDLRARECRASPGSSCRTEMNVGSRRNAGAWSAKDLAVPNECAGEWSHCTAAALAACAKAAIGIERGNSLQRE